MQAYRPPGLSTPARAISRINPTAVMASAICQWKTRRLVRSALTPITVGQLISLAISNYRDDSQKAKIKAQAYGGALSNRIVTLFLYPKPWINVG